ncbi:MAG: N-acetylmuramoyl-L-alanine amidase [Rhodospirillaceae bacterium]|jgi:N-acetylmuramoyl-L-alanine amidase|nr:N-acetylmuramoyl-L-alanine amidase [Rhodospirillaceae bacterium]
MSHPTVIDRPSPNTDDRPANGTIDILLLHYTGMQSAGASLERLCDPEAKVSAHYLIDEDGTVYGLVDEARRAWHAGVSYWEGATDINARSIGIELQNPGHEFGYRPFPEAQMVSLMDLCHGILTRHPIPPDRVLAHSDVAPQRKEDPGELFNWKRLAEAGIGRLPNTAVTAADPDDQEARTRLTGIGYDPEAPLDAVITAFQRHHRQTQVNGVIDAETMSLIQGLSE